MESGGGGGEGGDGGLGREVPEQEGPSAAAAAATPAVTGGSGEKPPKRMMKSPYQLEVLEKAYSVAQYPSESTRAELSAKIGLSDRQLQMWFCHRRLKDRKIEQGGSVRRRQQHCGEEQQLMPTPPVLPPLGVESLSGPLEALADPSSVPFGASLEKNRRGMVRAASAAVPRITGEFSGLERRFFDPLAAKMAPPVAQLQLSVAEQRVINSVVAQLGEPLRDDGPVLGMEFDALPPGAFGAPIEPELQKPPTRSYDGIFDTHYPNSMKGPLFVPSIETPFVPNSQNAKRRKSLGGPRGVNNPNVDSRSLREYHFLPEQPTMLSETYERPSGTQFYESPADWKGARGSSYSSGSQFLHGPEQVTPPYKFQGELFSNGILPPESRSQALTPVKTDLDSAPSNSFLSTPDESQFGSHRGSGSETLYLQSRDEDSSRVERKRKNDETRIAKEVEAYEKRIRKEIEKQDMLKRKREEQMRKEMERHDRERRKEEERMIREKQREVERQQREQRREIERREKFLQKEFQRAEKLRQKEELRKEREAARQKAATERATARKVAKEYTDLVEDERLELMELAARSKGFSSLLLLDSDTLQQLDAFRDMLSNFPSEKVKLKQPFAIQPWSKSEDNVGNLLMVWKFIITFCDVLKLWPLSLDEFVQSLHDYDSRLLGQVHVALLKILIKDIEDAGRSSTGATGMNQNTTLNPAGAHPQIVEGAYSWGFNVRNWQRHLNFLSWPEILRQFALSAGFGPQLKKRSSEIVHYPDDNEGQDAMDVISTLRNGAAAENAVARMKRRGYTHRHKSRHRLTPGTVKFAAFHVLSLEGSRGLTILEAADKIQKSGLRDLTTSKTPEASIAAALSRDTKLFERTAPSTYCVRSPYRKDSTEADSVLSAARDKIRVFQNELSDSEEPEKDDDGDDGERDEDSECDEDYPDADDANMEEKLEETSPFPDMPQENNLSTSNCERNSEVYSEIGSTTLASNFPYSRNNSSNGLLHEVASDCHETSTGGMDDTEIDESNYGESWVQGLTDGDYADLSVEERINALVTLIGIVIEGNTIRIILEERLESANALKKQMWAEAQLDKRRLKEEYSTKLQPNSHGSLKADATQIGNPLEGGVAPSDISDSRDVNENLKDKELLLDQKNPMNDTNMACEKNEAAQEFSAHPDSLTIQQLCHVEKTRSQLKLYIGHKAEELHIYRSLPLGQDRRRNRYWQFSTSASPDDPGSGRIFFESRDGRWRIIDSEEAFDALLSSLDLRGIREAHLHAMLLRVESVFKEAIRRRRRAAGIDVACVPSLKEDMDLEASPSSSLCDSDVVPHSDSFKIETGSNDTERSAISARYEGFMKWMWAQSHVSSGLCATKYGKKRCPEQLQACQVCYQAYLSEDLSCGFCRKSVETTVDRRIRVPCPLPIGVTLLKIQLAKMEALIPADALRPFWTDAFRKSWGERLLSSSSAEELLQTLTLLESAVKRDYLSSSYDTTADLLKSSAEEISAASLGAVSVLPWIPDTTAAVALRMLELDSSISYTLDQRLESCRDRKDFNKTLSRHCFARNSEESDLHHIDHNDSNKQPQASQSNSRWLEPQSGRRTRGGGRTGRGGGGVRGGGGIRRGRGRGRGGGRTTMRDRGVLPRGSEIADDNSYAFQKPPRKYTRRGGRSRGSGCSGRGRGRRSSRPRQAPNPRVGSAALKPAGFVISNHRSSLVEEPSRSYRREQDWGFKAEEENSSSSQSDDNEQAYEEEEDDTTMDYMDNYVAVARDTEMDAYSDDEDEEDDDDDGEDDTGDHPRSMSGGDEAVEDEEEEENEGNGEDMIEDEEEEEDDAERGSPFSSEYSE